MMLTARPTTYKGIEMRSRLEASFAADLDDHSAKWVYEPRAYANEHGQYLPDFQVLEYNGYRLIKPWFFEVRPTLERAYLAMPQMEIIWDSEPDAWLWIAVPRAIWFNAPADTRKWVVVR